MIDNTPASVSHAAPAWIWNRKQNYLFLIDWILCTHYTAVFSFKTSTVTWKELWGRCNKIRQVKFKANIKTLFHNDFIVWTIHRSLWTAACAKIKKCYSNLGVLAFYFRLSRAYLIAPSFCFTFCLAPNTRALSPMTSHTEGAPVMDKCYDSLQLQYVHVGQSS